jgi:hypothetical protein
MDLSLLRELIPLMHSNGVSSFKFEGLELSFQSLPKKKKKTSSPAATVSPPLTAAGDVQTPSPAVPQGMDAEMNFDKILNWSAPVDEGPVPLTNDAPLGDPTVEASNV